MSDYELVKASFCHGGKWILDAVETKQMHEAAVVLDKAVDERFSFSFAIKRDIYGPLAVAMMSVNVPVTQDEMILTARRLRSVRGQAGISITPGNGLWKLSECDLSHQAAYSNAVGGVASSLAAFQLHPAFDPELELHACFKVPHRRVFTLHGAIRRTAIDIQLGT